MTSALGAALVTGAGSAEGIGYATARRLVSQGLPVMLTSTTDRCLERAAELRALRGNVTAVVADLTNADEVDRMVGDALARFGRIDVVVNNAGMTSLSDPMPDASMLHDTASGAWWHTLQRNLQPTLLVTQAVLPHLRAQRYGRIVNVASTTGITGAMQGESAYAAAKAAIVGLTQTVAVENADHGITVNAVAPGWIATGSQTAHEERQGLATPVGRSGTPDEIAHVIAMLCHPDAGYLTGQCIVVDGGNAIAEERAT